MLGAGRVDHARIGGVIAGAGNIIVATAEWPVDVHLQAGQNTSDGTRLGHAVAGIPRAVSFGDNLLRLRHAGNRQVPTVGSYGGALENVRDAGRQ